MSWTLWISDTVHVFEGVRYLMLYNTNNYLIYYALVHLSYSAVNEDNPKNSKYIQTYIEIFSPRT